MKATPHTPQTAAALQMLYWAADQTDGTTRQTVFHAICHLSGQSLTTVAQIWESTR